MTDETTPTPTPELQAEFDLVVAEARRNSKLVIENLNTLEDIISGFPLVNPSNALAALDVLRGLSHDLFCVTDGAIGKYLHGEVERLGLVFPEDPDAEEAPDMSGFEAMLAAMFAEGDGSDDDLVN